MPPKAKPAAETSPAPVRAPRGAAARVSKPPFQQLLGQGAGYIPRRGLAGRRRADLNSLETIQALAIGNPTELLMMMEALVPEVGFAAHASTTLGCNPERSRMRAIKLGPDGNLDPEKTEHPEGTAAIRDLFARQKPELGGLHGALAQNYRMTLYDNWAACEATIDPRGVADIFPILTTTCTFKRETTGELAIYQRQVNGGSQTATGAGSFSDKPLAMERTFWANLPGLPEDPYGIAPFAPALNEALTITAFMRDLMLAWHRIGMPKLDVAFDFEGWAKYFMATGLTDQEEISERVEAERLAAIAEFAGLGADDAFFHGLADKVNAVGAGDKWPDVSIIWNMLMERLIRALKSNKILFGIVGGSGTTESWGSITWAIAAQMLEMGVAIAARPLEDVANLHLRLLGIPAKAVFEQDPIRTSERLTDAQAEEYEIKNAIEKWRQGFWTQQDASAALGCGKPSKPMDEPAASAPAPVADQQPKQNPPDKKARMEAALDAAVVAWDERIVRELEEVGAL